MADVDGLFKSPVLVHLLRLVLFERAEMTSEELAQRVDAPYPTITREVRRLQQLGIVTASTVGRTKLVAADRADPTVRALARFFSAAGLGPVPAPEGGEDMAKKKGKKKGGKKKKK